MAHRWISPSILAADFANIQRDVEVVNGSEADYLHIDIMDGIFVPNISFGFPVCAAIHQHTQKPLDYHLMIQHPDQYLEQCKKNGAEIISVHYEACPHLHRTVQAINQLDCKAGVAINPHNHADILREIIAEVDVVLVMSVNPGFGGQEFIPSTTQKVKDLRALAHERNPELIIEVDGGVNLLNAPELFEAGADMLVAGSSVFKSEDPISTIHKMKNV